MTKKEAIELFKDIEVLVFRDVKQNYFHEDIEDAFKKAIEALEQEPCVTMRDLSEEELKHFAEEMKKVRPQVIEQETVLDKIRAEIKEKIEQEEFARSVFHHEEKDTAKAEQCTGSIMAYKNVIKLIDKYKAESEG